MTRRRTRDWNGKTFRFDRPTKKLLYRAVQRLEADNPHLQFATLTDMAFAALLAPKVEEFQTMLDADLVGTQIDFSGVREVMNETGNKN